VIPVELDAINDGHIHGLVTNRAEEGPTLDFKRDLPGNGRDARKEFIADVCAFANTSGGDLVFGIDEDAEGRASAVVATDFNADEVITQLSSVLADGLEPRLHGVGMRALQMALGGRVLVLRVPRSYSGIHRSAQDGHFWIRESRSKRQLDVPGIANRFRDLFGREDRVVDFFARRYTAIATNTYPLSIDAGQKVVVHLLPARDFLSGEEVDLTPVSGPGAFPVIPNPASADASMTYEGVIHHSNLRNGQVRACTLLFRSGVVEAVASLGLAEDGAIPPLPLDTVEQYFFNFLHHSIVPTAAHLSGGWPIIARLAVVGAHLSQGRSTNRVLAFNIELAPVHFHGPVLTLPELLFEAPPANLARQLQAGFDRLWQAWGYDHAY